MSATLIGKRGQALQIELILPVYMAWEMRSIFSELTMAGSTRWPAWERADSRVADDIMHDVIVSSRHASLALQNLGESPLPVLLLSSEVVGSDYGHRGYWEGVAARCDERGGDAWRMLAIQIRSILDDQ